MLTPVDAEILEVAIPLRLTFRHAKAERKDGDSVLVRVTDAQGRTGWGECAPRTYVTGESAISVRATLERLLPGFLANHYASLEGLQEALTAASRTLPRNEHAAFCALELALLDLAGKVFGVSAGTLLGPVLTSGIDYSGVISADGAAVVEELCARMRQYRLHSVKLKAGRALAEDLEVLRIARSILGEECSLRVDANCAWSREETEERIAAFAPFRLDGLEQPVRADDFASMAALTATSAIPIIADESLVSTHDAEQLAALRGCHLFNVRISKCGGLANSWRVQEIGREAGIGCMLGAQVGETALLSAAGRQFATRIPDVRFCEGSFGKLLLEDDVAAEDLTFGPGGVAPALEGPGLGVTVLEARVRKHLRHDTRVRPS